MRHHRVHKNQIDLRTVFQNAERFFSIFRMLNENPPFF